MSEIAQTAARRNAPGHAGARVTVASKFPTGMRLRVFRMNDEREQTPNGVRDIKVARFEKEAFVNGTAKRLEDAPRCEIVGGYALTPNVDKDTWDRWREDNKDSVLVRDEMIFAHENPDWVRDKCRKHSGLLSGFEPLTGGDDPRAPKSNLRIEDEEGRAKAQPRRAA